MTMLATCAKNCWVVRNRVITAATGRTVGADSLNGTEKGRRSHGNLQMWWGGVPTVPQAQAMRPSDPTTGVARHFCSSPTGSVR